MNDDHLALEHWTAHSTAILTHLWEHGVAFEAVQGQSLAVCVRIHANEHYEQDEYEKRSSQT